MKNITTRPAYILWDISNRKNWQIAARGTREECETAMQELMFEGLEIHANEIKDSWNNEVSKIHYDTYMDGTIECRPMTYEEMESEGFL